MDRTSDHRPTPLGEADEPAVAAFWDRYLATEDPAEQARPRPEAWAFGDSVELADELIELVLDGTKAATAGAMADYEAANDPLPAVGDLAIVTDGSMTPRAVIRATEVRVGPLSSVDDDFAWDEGEGDRSRASWLENHTAFFGRCYQALGLEFHDDIPVVFERFEVVYRERP